MKALYGLHTIVFTCLVDVSAPFGFRVNQRTERSQSMKIRFTDADGETTELEISKDYHANLTVDVSTEVGTVYQESMTAERSNDRKNSRPDRHTSLDTFGYEDARFFGDGSDFLGDVVIAESVAHIMSCLSERQRYLIQKCLLDGWSYTDLAAEEGVTEGAIRHAVSRAFKRMKKFLS
jgi:RNA polymerase sigma-70 factor (ECF subfamily)